MTFQELLEIGRQKVVGHPKLAAGIQHFFRQEEAVFAIEVADSTRRLDQNVESRWRISWKSKAAVFMKGRRAIHVFPKAAAAG